MPKTEFLNWNCETCSARGKITTTAVAFTQVERAMIAHIAANMHSGRSCNVVTFAFKNSSELVFTGVEAD